MRTTPIECKRADACDPLHRVESDDGTTFVCCGTHPFGGDDPYRLCFRSEMTDTKYDHSELDLLDMVEVISRSLATRRRLDAG